MTGERRGNATASKEFSVGGLRAFVVCSIRGGTPLSRRK